MNVSASIHTEPHHNVPSSWTVRVVVVAPWVAFLACVGWSYVVGSALRGRLLEAGMPLLRIGYWATEVPLSLLWVPTALLGLTAVFRSALKGQGPQALLVTLYYLAALLLILLGAFVFSPAPIGDL